MFHIKNSFFTTLMYHYKFPANALMFEKQQTWFPSTHEVMTVLEVI